jgi:hypothetical protein
MRISPGLLIVISCFSAPLSASAQPSGKDSTIRSAAVYNAVQQYHRFIGNEAPLYNGRQYAEYESRIHEGHPFFQARDFHQASILYDGILYENIPLKFDLVKKNIVIQAPSGGFNVIVLEDKVSYFEVQGHKFIRLTKDSAGRKLLSTGFYDLLYDGKSIQLLKKETKRILEDPNGYDGLRRSIKDVADYYIGKAGVYYTANSKSRVLDLLKDQKPALRQYIRKNKLKFRADKENDLVKLIAYYDSIGN